MATNAVNKPPSAHPSRVHGNTRANSGGPSSDQHDPGLYTPCQDHRALPHHPQHHLPGRPVFYVHAPPPPPFHTCQWPMPFSYNPFAGFPGMGYGMVMPSFPPPNPYMEVPAYIMPRPHMQPVDYRRFIHPHAQAPSVAYQNPYQPCRVRPHHTDPVRETVNSEVQTDPRQRGGGFSEESPLISADSGSGTEINSPSSSSSSSQKTNSAEVENDALHSSNAKNLLVKGTSNKHGFNILRPTGTTAIQSCIRATLDTQKSRKENVGQENVPPCRNAHCNMWSVGSQDSMVPVCSSSQQEEEVVKERRISVPDILMSWGGGTPQETILKMAGKLLQNDLQSEVEQDKSVHQSGVETRISPEAAYPKDDAQDNFISEHSEVLFKILKLREAEEGQYAESRNNEESLGLVGSVRHCLPYADELLQSSSHKLPDNEQEYSIETNSRKDTTPIIPSINNSSYLKRTWNESIWSVESLAPFIPTKEWLQHNGLLAADVIEEQAENDNPIVKSREKCSSSDTSLSDSWLLFCTPAEKTSLQKKPERDSDMEASDIRSPTQAQGGAPSEKDRSASPNELQSTIIVPSPTKEDKNRSSEPEANRSPNQDILNEQQKKRNVPPQQEESLNLNSIGKTCARKLNLQNGAGIEVEDGARGNDEVSRLGKEQLGVPMADQKTAEVSPSKVDFGVQCNEFQEHKCACEERRCSIGPNRNQPFTYSDNKNGNYRQGEGPIMRGQTQKNQRKQGYRKPRGQYGSQHEAYSGYYGKPGKHQGGNGRNPPY
ncbi:hypothetical protein JOQ06_001113 [Pogonophryne albipinna]|uniref:Uncharacterized protein n=1 Tax=Pogonophryne albipinna TaxID=1090488 RepID=A0AAD6B4F4_9TELE|nr:hypothetical protein JOQ06_001113 [Pogonophryne albipinna]